jgi:hypothetical protein
VNSHSSAAPFVDVVTVPDFSNPARRAGFTARALFFLASWSEYAGTARDAWRVHLVCVGEVPRVFALWPQKSARALNRWRRFPLAAAST